MPSIPPTTATCWRQGLDIFFIGADNADMRKSEGHNLSGIGRIREDFLVSGHARVEHDLAARFPWSAGGYAAVPGAVFKCEGGVHLRCMIMTTGG